MRCWLGVLAVLVVLVSGCSHIVAGVAVPDPHRPGVALTDDGFGVLLGDADAPLQLVIFTEPQCPACARFQQRYGERIKFHLMTGTLAVTYRPMTFLDRHTRYSEHVSNAMLLAGDSTASATAFQSYVIELWHHQDPEGSPGPTDDQLAEWARDSGIPAAAAQRIADGESGVDVDALGKANDDELTGVGGTGTPTVYDLNAADIVNIDDEHWLDKLLQKT